MTKTEFMNEFGKYRIDVDHRRDEFLVGPDYRIASPDIKRLRVEFQTNVAYTKANLAHLKQVLDHTRSAQVEWSRLQAAYRKTRDYKDRKILQDILDLAARAGLEYDEHGTVVVSNGWGRDRYELNVLDYAHKKRDLKRYHACGKYLALVEQVRQRTYAASSKFGMSEAHWVFVVGTNENGVPFCHQVPKHIQTMGGAIAWIWNGHKIEQRQGDVAITRSLLKHVRGETRNERLIDSHFIFAEIYESQGTHIRNGFIYHERDQHPPIYVGSEWKKVIIARRSAEGMSSSD